MMVNYSKQNVLVEPRIEGLSGGLSYVPWRPPLAVVPDLRGPNGRTLDLALIWKPRGVLSSSPTHLRKRQAGK